MLRTFLSLLMTAIFGFLQAQERIALYNTVPNTKDTASISNNTPELYSYIPSNIKHLYVFLIIPGGGYTHIAMDHEGHQVATRLADLGYCSFVLKYRLPSAKQQLDKRIAPIQDAQRALTLIKKKIAEVPLHGAKVGVLGFSAGGHLASTLSTHFHTDYHQSGLAPAQLRPDFAVLVYPVITMEEGVTHNGSKQKLIGPEFNQEDIVKFSNEQNVNSYTPPTLLIHAQDDKTVPIENSYRYQQKLNQYNISNSLFSYAIGGHGFGMHNKQEPREWFNNMLDWLNNLKF